ncbi:unnamed protein product (macronuclear) [Paramecium tetraurelia]|uniref:Uncharacterized protein n=1 Tax=Paramecium tetraurelia TaxID=5888 RepID=A0E710_PARTE|nr:uncharacterized protein GSPATT00023805001 [Paramecium tetraurelia]CAK91077.1 unnamed protein product [Paramecium tetraurelia]
MNLASVVNDKVYLPLKCQSVGVFENPVIFNLVLDEFYHLDLK